MRLGLPAPLLMFLCHDDHDPAASSRQLCLPTTLLILDSEHCFLATRRPSSGREREREIDWQATMASSSFFHKPELALRRALELEGIHQPDAALALLHEVLSSRRHRTWSPAYEQIMIAYIDLCLKLFKSREAKDGLHQYRNLAQTQAPGSLEKVIRHLMDKAEQKCLEAKAYVDAEALANAASAPGAGGGGDDDDAAAAVADDDDEGFAASPQAILLSTMSTDPAKSQRDSTLLLPSLKFLWETYRAVLDILRSNSKLEHVYHAAAQSALAFCRTYKRRMEFRHLCDMLRLHLGNLRQYGGADSADTADANKASSKVRDGHRLRI
jgi:translation initiation factor 3 subunit A